jgi:hypothetical protein
MPLLSWSAPSQTSGRKPWWAANLTYPGAGTTSATTHPWGSPFGRRRPPPGPRPGSRSIRPADAASSHRPRARRTGQTGTDSTPALRNHPAVSATTARARPAASGRRLGQRPSPGNRVRSARRADVAGELAALKQRISALDEEIRVRFLARSEAPIVLSLPGMSRQTGPRFLAKVDEIDRFASPDALTAYAGLTPMLWQSGRSSGTHFLSRRCNLHLRQALWSAALDGLKTPASRRFFNCKRAEGKSHPTTTTRSSPSSGRSCGCSGRCSRPRRCSCPSGHWRPVGARPLRGDEPSQSVTREPRPRPRAERASGGWSSRGPGRRNAAL